MAAGSASANKEASGSPGSLGGCTSRAAGSSGGGGGGGSSGGLR